MSSKIPNADDRTSVARFALVMFVVGLLGFSLILVFARGGEADILSGCFLFSAELLAVIFGIIGWRRLPGKIAVAGVGVLLVWGSINYARFSEHREETRELYMSKTK